jgi:hypothetical protein
LNKSHSLRIAAFALDEIAGDDVLERRQTIDSNRFADQIFDAPISGLAPLFIFMFGLTGKVARRIRVPLQRCAGQLWESVGDFSITTSQARHLIQKPKQGQGCTPKFERIRSAKFTFLRGLEWTMSLLRRRFC